MNILIAGASGFIGRELTAVLSRNHQVTVLGRDSRHLEQVFPGSIAKITWDTLTQQDAKQFDSVINLSGANIGANRWTQQVKQELITSRTQTNKHLLDWLIGQEAHPHYYCANAIGIYGAHAQDTVPFDESSPVNDSDAANDFAKKICLDWQQSLQPALDKGMQVTTLRFGVVLKKGEGMLKKLELPFSLGLGSVFGSGQQVISWIHYEDVVSAIIYLLEHPNMTGPVNVTAPHAVTQKQFSKDLAAALKRPLLFSMPAFVVTTLFGEMGAELILKGQRVVPKRLLEQGYTFNYPTLEAALKHEYQK
jgi:uncharacterized protein